MSTHKNLPVEANEGSPKHSAAAIFLQSLALSLASLLALMFVFSFIAYKSGEPEKLIGVFSMISLYISAAVGGAFCTYKLSSPIISGAISGGIYLLVIVLSSLARGGQLNVAIWQAVILYALVPIFAIVGGAVGAKIYDAHSKPSRSNARRARRYR